MSKLIFFRIDAGLINVLNQTLAQILEADVITSKPTKAIMQIQHALMQLQPIEEPVPTTPVGVPAPVLYHEHTVPKALAKVKAKTKTKAASLTGYSKQTLKRIERKKK